MEMVMEMEMEMETEMEMEMEMEMEIGSTLACTPVHSGLLRAYWRVLRAALMNLFTGMSVFTCTSVALTDNFSVAC
jgi:hypothetical protein